MCVCVCRRWWWWLAVFGTTGGGGRWWVARTRRQQRLRRGFQSISLNDFKVANGAKWHIVWHLSERQARARVKRKRASEKCARAQVFAPLKRRWCAARMEIYICVLTFCIGFEYVIRVNARVSIFFRVSRVLRVGNGIRMFGVFFSFFFFRASVCMFLRVSAGISGMSPRMRSMSAISKMCTTHEIVEGGGVVVVQQRSSRNRSRRSRSKSSSSSAPRNLIMSKEPLMRGARRAQTQIY